jgi:anti-sigma B factor antagonist
MNFTTENQGKFTVITAVANMLDGTNASELKALFVQLNKDAVNQIVLDLNNVKYCDSSGLSAILIGHRLCRDAGGSFTLAGLQAAVAKIIAIAQLDKVFQITDKLETVLSQTSA